MATAVDTVSVSREAILDAIGWLMAADDLFIALNDDTDSSPGVLFTSAGFDLKIAAFGENPEGEDEYERDPIIVETWARGYEHAAEVIRVLEETRELVKPLDANDLAAQGIRLKNEAARMRAAGSLNTKV